MDMPVLSNKKRAKKAKISAFLRCARWGELCLAAASGFCAAQVQPVGGGAPFVLSHMACAGALFGMQQVASAALGCIAGCIFRGAYWQCLAVWTLAALGWLLERVKRKIKPAAWCAAAGIVQILTALPQLRWTWFDAVYALQNAALAAGVGYLFVLGVRSAKHMGRTRTTGESVSLVVSLCVLLCGLRVLDGPIVRPAETLITTLCLFAGYLGGPGVGAAVGVSMGVALGFTVPVRQSVAVMYGLCGLMAGLCRGLGKTGAAASFVVGGVLSYGLGTLSLQLAPLYQMLVASGVLLCVPKNRLEKLQRLFDREIGPALGEVQAMKHARAEAAGSLLGMGTLFESMGASLRNGGEGAQLVGRQLRAAGEGLRHAAQHLKRPVELMPSLQRSFAEQLARAGIRAREVQVCRTEQGYTAEMEIAACSGKTCCNVCHIAGHVFGRKMEIFSAPCLVGGCVHNVLKPVLGAKCQVQLRQQGKIQLRWGVYASPARQGDVCGDASLCRRLPDGRYLMAIADGMGQGKTAAEAAQEALSRLGSLLDAGLAPENALSLLNDWTGLCQSEVYTTMDICLIDPHKAEALFVKQGAPPSVLLRAGQRLEIESESLPMGVIPDANPGFHRMSLQRGDKVILLSDGVADRIGWDEGASELLSQMDTSDPQNFAEMLVALAMFATVERDDCTALVIQIQ